MLFNCGLDGISLHVKKFEYHRLVSVFIGIMFPMSKRISRQQ